MLLPQAHLSANINFMKHSPKEKIAAKELKWEKV